MATDITIIGQVVEQLNLLPDAAQRQVLEYVRTLQPSTPGGKPTANLLRFAGTIPLDDLELMRTAIEAGCEQVDPNDW